MAFCTKCGALLEEDSGFCVKCGVKVEPKGRGTRCGLCGNLVEDGLHYCSYCGADLSESLPAKSEVPATQWETQASRPPQQPDISPAEPSGPERELYRRGMVTWLGGVISSIGTVSVSTHRFRFTPSKLYLTVKPLELPLTQITGVNTANIMLAVPGGMQVQTADGKTYTFGFGAINVSESERAVQVIREALGSLRQDSGRYPGKD